MSHAVRRQLHELLHSVRVPLGVSVERDTQTGRERVGTIVGSVHVHPAKTLVCCPDGHRRECAAQVMVGDLRLAAMIDHAPAGSRHEVAQPQHESTATWRCGAARLAEDLGHDLAGHRARELEVAVVVDAPQLARVDVEQQREIVIANVLEVPPAPGVTRHSRLPAGMVDGEAAGRVGEHLLDGALVRHVGEGQALRGEADLGAAGVLQRPAVAADPVVVGHATIGPKRQIASARRRRDVHSVHAASWTRAGSSSPNSSPRPNEGSSPSIATCCSISLLPHSTARLGRPARLPST